MHPDEPLRPPRRRREARDRDRGGVRSQEGVRAEFPVEGREKGALRRFGLDDRSTTRSASKPRAQSRHIGHRGDAAPRRGRLLRRELPLLHLPDRFLSRTSGPSPRPPRRRQRGPRSSPPERPPGDAAPICPAPTTPILSMIMIRQTPWRRPLWRRRAPNYQPGPPAPAALRRLAGKRCPSRALLAERDRPDREPDRHDGDERPVKGAGRRNERRESEREQAHRHRRRSPKRAPPRRAPRRSAGRTRGRAPRAPELRCEEQGHDERRDGETGFAGKARTKPEATRRPVRTAEVPSAARRTGGRRPGRGGAESPGRRPEKEEGHGEPETEEEEPEGDEKRRDRRASQRRGPKLERNAASRAPSERIRPPTARADAAPSSRTAPPRPGRRLHAPAPARRRRRRWSRPDGHPPVTRTSPSVLTTAPSTSPRISTRRPRAVRSPAAGSLGDDHGGFRPSGAAKACGAPARSRAATKSGIARRTVRPDGADAIAVARLNAGRERSAGGGRRSSRRRTRLPPRGSRTRPRDHRGPQRIGGDGERGRHERGRDRDESAAATSCPQTTAPCPGEQSERRKKTARLAAKRRTSRAEEPARPKAAGLRTERTDGFVRPGCESAEGPGHATISSKRLRASCRVRGPPRRPDSRSRDSVARSSSPPLYGVRRQKISQGLPRPEELVLHRPERHHFQLGDLLVRELAVVPELISSR